MKQHQIIADAHITRPFRVLDRNTGHYIFSLLSPHDAGDIPPDIAVLPILALRSVWTPRDVLLIVETACGQAPFLDD